MPKRIQLPSADQLLVGVNPLKADKHQNAKALNMENAHVRKAASREHISTYLSTELLKKLEETRTRLFVERNCKLTKAEVLERALRLGLQDLDALLLEA